MAGLVGNACTHVAPLWGPVQGVCVGGGERVGGGGPWGQ